MKLKPNIGISIKHYATAIAVGGLLGVPAITFGATAASPAYKVSAQATAQPKTKAEVLSQLRQAERRGNFVVNAETGKKAYQARPSAYPGHEMQPHKSRAEVLMELRQARRNGNYIINAETGRKANGEIAGWG